MKAVRSWAAATCSAHPPIRLVSYCPFPVEWLCRVDSSVLELQASWRHLAYCFWIVTIILVVNVAADNKVFALGLHTIRLQSLPEPLVWFGMLHFVWRDCSYMEARIRDLCSALLSTKEPEAIEKIGEQLRCAIHDHVEEMRLQVNDLPVVTNILRAS